MVGSRDPKRHVCISPEFDRVGRALYQAAELIAILDHTVSNNLKFYLDLTVLYTLSVWKRLKSVSGIILMFELLQAKPYHLHLDR